VYGLTYAEIALSLRGVLAGPNVVIDREAVGAGLAVMEAGGDFADGVIAFHGRRSGGEVFVSFDRQAVRLIRAQGYEAKLL
jgi:predicted nucleic-acid-binding protein